MTETSEKIIKNIKECNMCPKPRWIFTVKNCLFWCMFILSLIVGALSFAVIANVLTNHDWDIYVRLHKNFLQFILMSLPYLWIVCLILFSWIAYFEFVHTKGWYQRRVYMVVSASVVSSLGLGVIFMYSGIGKKIDRILDSKMPFYGMMNINKKNIWCHPDKGLLGGEIVGMPIEPIELSHKIVVKDCHGNEWLITMPHPQMMPPIKPGERIKIIGRENKGQGFYAEEVRSW